MGVGALQASYAKYRLSLPHTLLLATSSALHATHLVYRQFNAGGLAGTLGACAGSLVERLLALKEHRRLAPLDSACARRPVPRCFPRTARQVQPWTASPLSLHVCANISTGLA